MEKIKLETIQERLENVSLVSNNIAGKVAEVIIKIYGVNQRVNPSLEELNVDRTIIKTDLSMLINELNSIKESV